MYYTSHYTCRFGVQGFSSACSLFITQSPEILPSKEVAGISLYVPFCTIDFRAYSWAHPVRCCYDASTNKSSSCPVLSGPELVELLKFANSSNDIKCFIFGPSKFPVSHCLFCILALSNSPRLDYHVIFLHRTLHGDSVSFYLSFLTVVTCFSIS